MTITFEPNNIPSFFFLHYLSLGSIIYFIIERRGQIMKLVPWLLFSFLFDFLFESESHIRVINLFFNFWSNNQNSINQFLKHHPNIIQTIFLSVSQREDEIYIYTFVAGDLHEEELISLQNIWNTYNLEDYSQMISLGITRSSDPTKCTKTQMISLGMTQTKQPVDR